MFGRECIWLVGAKGQLGQAILRQIKKQNPLITVLTTDKDVDITEMAEVSRFAITNHPSVIINCAGMTNVQACDEDKVMAYKVNALGARNIAAAARIESKTFGHSQFLVLW